MNIREFIPIGHENAITKQDLIRITNLNDRRLRVQIEIANQIKGEKPIINMMDGKGYFMPADNEDNLVQMYRMSEISRSRKIENKIRVINDYFTNKNQIKMEL